MGGVYSVQRAKRVVCHESGELPSPPPRFLLKSGDGLQHRFGFACVELLPGSRCRFLYRRMISINCSRFSGERSSSGRRLAKIFLRREAAAAASFRRSIASRRGTRGRGETADHARKSPKDRRSGKSVGPAGDPNRSRQPGVTEVFEDRLHRLGGARRVVAHEGRRFRGFEIPFRDPSDLLVSVSSTLPVFHPYRPTSGIDVHARMKSSSFSRYPRICPLSIASSTM